MPRPSPFAIVLGSCLLFGGAFIAWARGAAARDLAEAEERWGSRIEPGDLVFQDLACGLRCELIDEVTHSRYAHVGIVLEENGARVVWEALGPPVGPVPLAEWKERGRDRRMAVYRMDEATRASLPAISREIRAMAGKPYDPDYQWDDDRIYCSELVAKAMARALGRDLFTPHPLGTGAFGSRAAVISRMSKGRLTEATPLVTPADLVRSGILHRIADDLH